MKYLLIIFIAFIHLGLNAQRADTPKYEMRSVWVATVANLDWPKKNDRGNIDAQKTSLITMLDSLQSINLNAIFLQIRTECDAFYRSSYEPWSRYLTGTQGENPGYDPLEFALTETHNRGMELHAWLNPYRVNVSSNDSDNYYGDGHVYLEHPEWILEYTSANIAGKKILNPGLPEVQEYIKQVVGDIISKYDIDGIHFDDYFYAYAGTPEVLDIDAYNNYKLGGESLGDFRRRSINKMIANVWDTIQNTRPYIRFGVSPFGIHGNGIDPPGIVGLDAYNVIYSDPLTWLREGTVDYINPQLYWPTGGNQDFGILLPWWANFSDLYDRHVFAGHGIYRMNSNPGFDQSFDEIYSYLATLNISQFESHLFSTRLDQWNLAQILTQVEITRNNADKGALGSVFFRAADFERISGLKSKLKQTVYKYPSLFPAMYWKYAELPVAPKNIRYIKNSLTGNYELSWEHPMDSLRFAVYGTPEANPSIDLIPENLLGISYTKSFPNSRVKNDTINSIYITTIDRTGRESTPSNLFPIPAPSKVDLIEPVDNYDELAITDSFIWKSTENCASYKIAFSDSPEFNDVLLSLALTDTSVNVDILNLMGETIYYWRVNGFNLKGEGPSSDIRRVETAIPAVPIILHPENDAVEVALRPQIEFYASDIVDSVHLQISQEENDFDEFDMLIDTMISSISTPFIPAKNLEAFTTHYLRLSSSNSYGTSFWSPTVKFKTLMPVPEVPVISEPLNNQLFSNLNSEIKLVWNKLPTAITYQVQIADDPEFLEMFVDETIYNSQEYSYHAPLPDNWHYVRVAGKNIGGMGEWSKIVRFGLGDPTAIFEQNAGFGFSVYPNPSATGKFVLAGKEIPGGAFKILLYSQSGLLLTTENIPTSAITNYSYILDFSGYHCSPCIMQIIIPKIRQKFSTLIYQSD